MKNCRFYPSWVYSVREDWTRANMARYDREQTAIDKRCIEINPDYYKLPLTARFAVRKQAENDLHIN